MHDRYHHHHHHHHRHHRRRHHRQSDDLHGRRVEVGGRGRKLPVRRQRARFEKWQGLVFTYGIKRVRKVSLIGKAIKFERFDEEGEKGPGRWGAEMTRRDGK